MSSADFGDREESCVARGVGVYWIKFVDPHLKMVVTKRFVNPDDWSEEIRSRQQVLYGISDWFSTFKE